MSDIVLLKLIDSLSDDMGFANGKAVEAAYGDGFTRALREAWDAHEIDHKSPMGSYKLSPTGLRLARR